MLLMSTGDDDAAEVGDAVVNAVANPEYFSSDKSDDHVTAVR